MPRKHTKIYYRPGLISLITVPFLFYYFGSARLRTINKNVLVVNWYDKGYWDTMMKKYPFIHFVVPKRNTLELNLTGNVNEDEIKLKFGELYIKEIISNRDTIHAINFHLGGKCKYSTLVRILDICNINEVNYFVPSDSGILMYYVSPPKATHKNDVQPI